MSRLILVILGFSVLIILTTITTLSSHAQQDEGEYNISFLWAFGVLVKEKEGEGQKLVSITRDTQLKSGARIKFFVKLEKSSFVYLVYHSSQGDVTVLFPYRFGQLSGGYQAPVQDYIPQGNEWFELDKHVGLETFYLLASAQRLHDLEQSINKYETADPSRKPELAEKILGEIRRLGKKHMKFTTLAEKPANITGLLRAGEKVEKGDYPDVASLAVQIRSKDFFSRTFTIEHRK